MISVHAGFATPSKLAIMFWRICKYGNPNMLVYMQWLSLGHRQLSCVGDDNVLRPELGLLVLTHMFTFYMLRQEQAPERMGF